MVERGFPKRFAAAVIKKSGLGTSGPPSIVTVLFDGSRPNTSGQAVRGRLVAGAVLAR